MTAHPKRIQRQRTAGWRMPEGAIYVGRPTRWGNPCRLAGRDVVEDKNGHAHQCAPGEAPGVSVRLYQDALERGYLAVDVEDVEAELRGRDLACWCPLDQPCHADVLLRVANRRAG